MGSSEQDRENSGHLGLGFVGPEGTVSSPMYFSSRRFQDVVSRIGLQRAIALSADYLLRVCNRNGKFVYVVNMDPSVQIRAQYNIVRHAGALYALATFARRYQDDIVIDRLRRASEALKQGAISPVPDREDLLAVWSVEQVKGNTLRNAKLGAAGLGLLALCTVEEVDQGRTPLEDLRRLGDFILFLQKEDGSFYSRFFPDHQGKDDSWSSVYYPGEAALGLLALFELDPQQKWLEGAARAIIYLAMQRAGESLVEPDHWALLATARLFSTCERAKIGFSQEPFMGHAIQICKSMLATTTFYRKDAPEYGCLTKQGRTCPTATRLEGLLASLTFLSQAYPDLRQRIKSTVTRGMTFLLRAQISSGKFGGGIPRAVAPLPASETPADREFNERASEIRIDYVQHALCAMMQYDEIYF